MQTVSSIHELRRQISMWRDEGQRVAFVPTMGNLHDGHLSLVREAQNHADQVVVSIFVNSLQFGQGEDFSTYPRTEAEDILKLKSVNTDLLFFPAEKEIYLQDAKTLVTLSGLSEMYCGQFRPGHFNGVLTVVCKLLNMVQPDQAFFGEKDFQQLVLIETMVRDLNIPVKVNGVATFREKDGLAMSSRNSYLTAEQRSKAPMLYQALTKAEQAIITGKDNFTDIEVRQIRFLQETGFQPEYFSICRASDLLPASKNDTELVILAAVKMGKARLIDNIRVLRP